MTASGLTPLGRRGHRLLLVKQRSSAPDSVRDVRAGIGPRVCGLAGVSLGDEMPRERAYPATGASNLTFDARKATTTVVTRGVFRLSRNPVYLSMLLLQMGVALLTRSVWILVLGVPAGSLYASRSSDPKNVI